MILTALVLLLVITKTMTVAWWMVAEVRAYFAAEVPASAEVES